MHDCHFDYIKKLTKTHEYVLCGSVQDQMETQSKVSKDKSLAIIENLIN